MASTFEVYKDKADEYRWRLRDGNNEITADSGEGYDSESNCKRAIANVKADVPGAPIKDV
jgi:uncharacterized protein YegP (UPF0339 family)